MMIVVNQPAGGPTPATTAPGSPDGEQAQGFLAILAALVAGEDSAGEDSAGTSGATSDVDFYSAENTPPTDLTTLAVLAGLTNPGWRLVSPAGADQSESPGQTPQLPSLTVSPPTGAAERLSLPSEMTPGPGAKAGQDRPVQVPMPTPGMVPIAPEATLIPLPSPTPAPTHAHTRHSHPPSHPPSHPRHGHGQPGDPGHRGGVPRDSDRSPVPFFAANRGAPVNPVVDTNTDGFPSAPVKPAPTPQPQGTPLVEAPGPTAQSQPPPAQVPPLSPAAPQPSPVPADRTQPAGLAQSAQPAQPAQPTQPAVASDTSATPRQPAAQPHRHMAESGPAVVDSASSPNMQDDPSLPPGPAVPTSDRGHGPGLTPLPRVPEETSQVVPTAKTDQLTRTGGQRALTEENPAVVDGPRIPEDKTSPIPVSSAAATTQTSAAESSEPTQASGKAPTTTAYQLAENIAPLRRGPDGVHRLTVLLHPADLGAVQVVAEIRGGEISLQLAGTTEVGWQALTASLPQLRKELADAGFDQCSVVLRQDAPGQSATDSQDRPNQQWGEQQLGNHAQRDDRPAPEAYPDNHSARQNWASEAADQPQPEPVVRPVARPDHQRSIDLRV